MKGFLEEYGLIIVVVAVILLMLLFGKTGYAKSIQDAILGSADHIVETGENITKEEAGDILEIEGTKYIILEKQKNNRTLVMTVNTRNSSGGCRVFSNESLSSRSDGQNWNTYKGSDIDNYLENEWYNSLSSTMKAAIQPANIKQISQSDNSNTISRHVFLPSVREVEKIVDLKDRDKSHRFLEDNKWGYEPIWIREKSDDDVGRITILYSGYSNPSIVYTYMSGSTYGARPAFVIDLSKVDYKVAGHTDYK